MKWIYLVVVVFVLGVVLGGCSATKEPEYAKYANCDLPVTRDAGMGIRVDGCAAWSFGPSRKQQAQARYGLISPYTKR